MTTLTEFLTARLDGDEAVAIAATEGPWSVDRDGEVYQTNSLREVPCTRLDGSKYISTDQINVTCDSEGMRASVQLENATHIALHDPARTLREVAAKREMVAVYKHALETWDIMGDGFVVLERAIHALAAVYSDHSDYNHEWAVS